MDSQITLCGDFIGLLMNWSSISKTLFFKDLSL